MQNEHYVRESMIVEKTEMEKEIELLKTIIKTREELKIANRNFEYAKEDLVDYYTYQIKANQAKLDYLIKLAKTKGIEVDMIDDIKLSLWDEEVRLKKSNICPTFNIEMVIRNYYYFLFCWS